MVKLAPMQKVKADRERLRYELTQGLNKGQADAFMVMMDFLTTKGSDDMFVLKGYAGTGKTFLIKKLIEHMTKKYPHTKIAVTAPTNKAVSVLESKNTFRGNIKYATIHSLLGLTETIDSQGRVSFTSKGNNSTITNFHYLIVDEVSMLQDEIFHMIAKYSKSIKIIFMGDPAQIPPIGKLHSIPLSKCVSRTYEEGYTLTQIMRQSEGNPIIKASFAIRDNLTSPNPIERLETETPWGHGLVRLYPNKDRETLLSELELHFVSSPFEKDTDYAKVIAWRNKTVDLLNQTIREMIYKGHPLTKVMVGEKVLANKPIFDEDEDILFTTSEEFEIGSTIVIDKTVRFGGKEFKGKFYLCGTKKGKIKILHESSEKDYQIFLDSIKQKAITTKDSKIWVEFYKAMKYPADIAYNYAITAHKAQGSTYENVFIMEDDIDANHNIVERNRIKYTAYSRASRVLFIYKS